MNALTRGLIATAPVAALLMAPALANAHPNNDTQVTVTSYSSTVQVDIFNYHDYAIDCQTSVDGGSLLFMTAPAGGTGSTWHGGTAAGTHTVTWSCSSDGGAVSHSGGSKTVTVAETTTPDTDKKKQELCDFDFLGGFEKWGICPKK